MENKKNSGTDAFGRELPEKTPEEIKRDIENILNYKPKPKETPKLEEAVENPYTSQTYKLQLKDYWREFIPVYGLAYSLVRHIKANPKNKKPLMDPDKVPSSYILLFMISHMGVGPILITSPLWDWANILNQIS